MNTKFAVAVTKDNNTVGHIPRGISVVPQMVTKIAICDCPMASGDCLVALIAKLVKVGGV